MISTNANGNGAPQVAPSVNLASPRLASPAKPKSAKPKGVAKSVWDKACEAAMDQVLSGNLKSEFDSKTKFGVANGVPDALVLVGLRDKLLNSAAIELQGVHTPKGVGNIWFAKAIVAAIGKLGEKDARDREARPVCQLAWRRCSALFALVRDTNGTFETVNFGGSKASK